MKYIISFILVLCGYVAGAQSILPLRADTVVIEKTGGNGELKIKNRTRDSLGLMINVGGGRTEFRRAKVLNDSTVVIGLDTLTIKGGISGGGGGTGNISGTLVTGRVVIPDGTNSITTDPNLLFDPATNLLTADSISSYKWRGDSLKLSRQFFTYLPTGLEGWGDSFVFGSFADPRTDSGFAFIFSNYMGLPLTISALSGTGSFYNVKNFHASVGLSNTRFQFMNVGYNDLRATGNNVKTYAKNVNAYKTAFVNHFAAAYVDAGGTGVTRSGTWTTGVNATIHAGKSANAAYTHTLNDTLTYTFSGTTVYAVLMGSDGIVSNYSNVDVIIDGVLNQTVNSNNQTDGAVVFANPNHTDSVFTYPVLIHGLSNGSHTLKLVNKTAGQRMYVDHVGTLAPASTKPPFGIFHLIGIEPYYLTNNTKVDSMVTTLPTGYPFAVFKVNNYFVEGTDMDVDGVHPNNSGHRHYADEMKDHFSPISANLADGIITWDQWLYATSNGTSKQVPYTEDVWTKNNDNIEFAGNISIPASKSYSFKQGSVITTNYDAVLTNGRLFGGGNSTMTGAANLTVMPGAGAALTTANHTIAIGQSAGLNVTTGGGVHIGGFTNAFATTGVNVAVGLSAIQFGAGTGNTAVGTAALQGNVSFPFNSSTAVGNAAGQGNRADNGIYFGSGAGFSQNITGAKAFIMGLNAGLIDPTQGNSMNINNFFTGRGMGGQGISLAGQLGLKTWYPGRNTVRVGGSLGITLDSVDLKTDLTNYNLLVIGKSTSGVDTGTVAMTAIATVISSGIAAGTEGSVQYKTGSALNGNSEFKRIDSIKAVVANRFLADRYLRAGDSVHRYKPVDTLVAFGNSITAGTGTVFPVHMRYSTLTANALNLVEWNFGIGGTTMVQVTPGDSSAIDRLYVLPNKRPTLKYIFGGYGTNDWRTSIDTASFRAAYNRWIDTLMINRGWPADSIILVTPGYSIHATPAQQPRLDQFVNITKDLAAKKGVRAVDTKKAMLLYGADAGLKSDSVHLNEYGNEIWALAILDTLRAHSGDVRASYGFFRNLTIRQYANKSPLMTGIDQDNNAYYEVKGSAQGLSANFTANLYLGLWAGDSTTTGTNNYAIGQGAMRRNTTGNRNFALGSRSLFNNITGSDNVAIGTHAAWNSTGDRNTAIGNFALLANTSGTKLVGIGYTALSGNTTGINNTAIGDEALSTNSTGNNNTAIGTSASKSQTVGGNNTTIGAFAGQNVTSGGNNTLIGQIAGQLVTTGSNNTGIGKSALAVMSGGASQNTAIGTGALAAMTTPNSNTAIGYNAMILHTTGANNLAIGAFAQTVSTTATNSTSLGYQSHFNLVSGSNNLAVGQAAGANLISGSNNVNIGSYAWPSNTTVDKRLTIADGLGNLWIGGDSAQNVGIGTIAPQYKLHVNGNFGINTVTSGSGTDSLLTINNNLVYKVSRNSAVVQPSTQIVYGTGTGITSNSDFTYNIGTKSLTVNISNGITNSIAYPLTLSHTTSGTNAAGSGVGFNFVDEDAAGNNQGIGVIEAVYTNTTAGNIYSLMRFKVGTPAGYASPLVLDGDQVNVRTNLFIDSVNTGASTDSILVINSREVKKISGNDLARQVINAGTTDFTITIGALTVLPSLAGAANRTITLPAASSHTGKFIFLWNKNADANLWSFGSTYTQPNGTTSSTIGNGTYSAYQSTGSEWLQIQNN